MQIPFESVAGLRSDPSAFQLPKASATEQTGSVPFEQQVVSAGRALDADVDGSVPKIGDADQAARFGLIP